MAGRYDRYMAAVRKLDELEDAGYFAAPWDEEEGGSSPGAASALDARNHQLAKALALGQYEWIETLTPEAKWCETPFKGVSLIVLLGLRDSLAEGGAEEDSGEAKLVEAALSWGRQPA